MEISELQRIFGQWDARLNTLFGLAEECTKWTLLQGNEATNWCHSDGKFALMGDAAHAVLPYLLVRTLLDILGKANQIL